VNCPVCQTSTIFVSKFNLKDYRIGQCQICETFYNSNFGLDKIGSQVFDRNYFEDIQEPAFNHVKQSNLVNESSAIYHKYLNIVQHKIQRKGTLLDVGAAFGDFVMEAEANGWDARGVEISEYASGKARNERHLNVLTGTIESIDVAEKFDLITYWDVIEHVENCSSNLIEARKRLYDKGMLLIATDNYQSFLGVLCNLIYKMSFGKITYPIRRFFIKQNTIYPKKESFIKLLEKNGYRIVYFEPIDYPIKKIKLSFIESIILKVIYFIGKVLRANTQMLILCERI
jgi:2-polyprenyl-3-methyl-5-hydroxy-6-metoxy-1,4-benzoquinol methylase